MFNHEHCSRKFFGTRWPYPFATSVVYIPGKEYQAEKDPGQGSLIFPSKKRVVN